jgi:pSer/pThr/pTyr-binding forkhead associated (FHA) protein
MQNKEKIRLGRDIDSDIRIADIAVSRCHATILFQENKF